MSRALNPRRPNQVRNPNPSVSARRDETPAPPAKCAPQKNAAANGEAECRASPSFSERHLDWKRRSEALARAARALERRVTVAIAPRTICGEPIQHQRGRLSEQRCDRCLERTPGDELVVNIT